MKTLKKTLCLVLAMVMVFGLCAVSASAKLDSYTDKDDITYAEAVDVMTGIGILQGDERGFRPTDDITRAEAAKIIAYIMVGNAGQADALKAGSDPFTDVPASHWAAGYISYCATAGIIGGMGDGSYHPSENVTGLQFAKMLLSALGYGVNDEYTGADWAINVSRDALRLGVFDDNLAGATNTAATREECALYAFNTITGIDKVSYSALLGGYITSTGIGGTATDSPDANKETNFADDYKLKSEPKASDDFGKDTGHYWYLNTSRKPIITADYDADKNLKMLYTSKVTGADIYNLLGSDVTKDTTQLEVYVNGTKTGTGYDNEAATGGDGTGAVDTGIKLANFKKANDKTLDGTGNGVQTYVYAKYVRGTLRVKICVVDTYLAQVTKVVPAKGSKDAETTVKLVIAGANVIPGYSYTFKTEDFEKDDYVLVTIADKDNADGNLNAQAEGKVVTMIPAITKETEVTKYTKVGDKISIVADGETYTAAKNSAGKTSASDAAQNEKVDSAAGLSNKIVDGDDYTLYIDEYGYLIATSPVAATSNYVYVAQLGVKSSTDDALTDEDVLRADVYYADGTHEIVTVDISTDNNPSGGNYPFRAYDIAHFDKDTANTYGTGDIGLYAITMVKGKAVLSKANITGNTGDGSNDYVTKGQARLKNTDKANNSTVFFYVKNPHLYGKSGFSVTIYTGIDTVPTVKNAEKEVALLGQYAKNSSNVIKAAVVKTTLSGVVNETVYYFGGTQATSNFTKNGDGSVEYKVYGVDGVDYLTVKYDSTKDADTAIETTLLDAGFVKLNADGKLEYATTDRTTATEVNKVFYLDTATITDISGDSANTLKVSYTGNSNVDMPLYDVESIVDLRSDDHKSLTDGEFDSVEDLLTALEEHTSIDYTVAISFTGAGDTNVISTIYVLANA